MHHICSDGWSTGIFIREFEALYQAYMTGQPSPLPELTIQYGDYVQWQRAWIQGDVLEGQLAYWKQKLANPPSALELPIDRPSAHHPNFSWENQIRLLIGKGDRRA